MRWCDVMRIAVNVVGRLELGRGDLELPDVVGETPLHVGQELALHVCGFENEHHNTFMLDRLPAHECAFENGCQPSPLPSSQQSGKQGNGNANTNLLHSHCKRNDVQAAALAADNGHPKVSVIGPDICHRGCKSKAVVEMVRQWLQQ